jgi:hypothetical protein
MVAHMLSAPAGTPASLDCSPFRSRCRSSRWRRTPDRESSARRACACIARTSAPPASWLPSAAASSVVAGPDGAAPPGSGKPGTPRERTHFANASCAEPLDAPVAADTLDPDPHAASAAAATVTATDTRSVERRMDRLYPHPSNITVTPLSGCYPCIVRDRRVVASAPARARKAGLATFGRLRRPRRQLRYRAGVPSSGASRFSASISTHRATQSVQIATPGPAMTSSTWPAVFEQNEQRREGSKPRSPRSTSANCVRRTWLGGIRQSLCLRSRSGPPSTGESVRRSIAHRALVRRREEHR